MFLLKWNTAPDTVFSVKEAVLTAYFLKTFINGENVP